MINRRATVLKYQINMIRIQFATLNMNTSKVICDEFTNLIEETDSLKTPAVSLKMHICFHFEG